MARTGFRQRTGLAVLACVTGAVLFSADAALSAPRRQRVKVPVHIHADEALTFRFAKRVPASKVDAQRIQILPEEGGEPARGELVAGKFLRSAATGGVEVVDPDAYRLAMEVAYGMDAATARSKVDLALTRYARKGELIELTELEGAVSKLFETGFIQRWAVRTGDEPGIERTLPQQDASAPERLRQVRLRTAGDDALWAAHVAGSTTAFAQLAAEPGYARFHHSIDPSTGAPFAESDMRRRENRRVLFTGVQSGKTFTFVPEAPQTFDSDAGNDGDAYPDAGLLPNRRYRFVVAKSLPAPLGTVTASGVKIGLRHRVGLLETSAPFDTAPGATDPTPTRSFALSEFGGSRLRAIDLTPPSNELLVDATTDWEDPDDRHVVPLSERKPFRVRVRFDRPLDPRSVTTSTIELRKNFEAVGTPQQRLVYTQVPFDVHLTQRRLGEVELEITPRTVLDPGCSYVIRVSENVRSLDGRGQSGTLIHSEFTTATFAEDAVGADE